MAGSDRHCHASHRVRFLANYYLFSDRLPPGLKVCLLYTISFGLLGLGTWVERTRGTLKNYGEVLAAGGFASVYFTTFSAYRVEQLQVIHSPFVAGVLLLLWAGVMVAAADWRKSQTLGIMGVLLGYYTLLINEATLFSLFSALVLALAAVVLLLRNRWMVVGYLSLSGTYLSFAYWRYPYVLEWFANVQPRLDHFWPPYLFLLCYWLIFTAAVFLSSGEKLNMERRSGFAGLNNSAFLLLFGLGMVRYFPDQLWLFSFVSGLVCTGLTVPATRLFGPLAANSLASLFLAKGILLITLAFLIRLSGVSLALTLAAESTMLLVMALRRDNNILKIGAFGSAILAVLYTLVCELSGPGTFHFGPIVMNYPGDIPFSAGIGQALFFFFGSYWIQRHNETFEQSTRELQDKRSFFLIILGVVCASFCSLLDLPADWRAFGFLIAGILCAAAASLPQIGMRFRDQAIVGQVFSVVGLIFFILGFEFRDFGMLLSMVTFLGILGLIHWSTFSQLSKDRRELFNGYECILSFGFTLSLFLWLGELTDKKTWLYLAGLTAIAQWLYGLKTGANFLAGFSQLFHVVGFVVFWTKRWTILQASFPLTLLVLNLVFIHICCCDRKRSESHEGIFTLGLFILRGLAVTMFLGWLDRFFPIEWQALLVSGAAVVLFLPAVVRNHRQLQFFAFLLLAFAIFHIVETTFSYGGPFWPSYLAAAGPLGMQRILRRFSDGASEETVQSGLYHRAQHPILIVIGLLLLWWVLSSDVKIWAQGFYLTVTWSLFAFATFGAGWTLKERTYRLASLAILGATLMRVLVIDVWALDQVARIWSFIVIGVVLMALGYVYSRFQENLKRYF